MTEVPVIAEDPGPPYLFVDLYPLDFDNPATPQLEDPPWERALDHPEVFGVILKATDGVSYSDRYVQWFVRNFKRLVELAGERRGKTLLFGGYHFAQFFADPHGQADFYLKALAAAGWGTQDIVPIIDVEDGGERAANGRASAQQVIDCISGIAERLRSLTGRRIMLYGRSAMRDRSIASKMGCDLVWNPSYTKTMVLNGLVGKLPDGQTAPWTLDDITGWQYGGDGVGDNSVTHLELDLTGFGKVDLTVAIDGALAPTWPRTRQRFIG